MDNTIEKHIQNLRDRLTYLADIFVGKHRDNAQLLEEKLAAFEARARAGQLEDPFALSWPRWKTSLAMWNAAWKRALPPWIGCALCATPSASACATFLKTSTTTLPRWAVRTNTA